MSTYRKIHGRSIQAVTTDPSETVAEGQVWYNTTSDTFKSAINFQAWSSASPLIVGRNAMATSDGSTTAAFAAGGNPDSTEEWNGSGFSTGGALTTSRRYLSGCGTLTAGLAFGGNKSPLPTLSADTEEYNGTSFSEQNDLNTARQFLGRAGTQTAGLAFAGTAGPGASAATEEYNGTSWTSISNMGTVREAGMGAARGSTTAGLMYGGESPSPTANTELWNGSSWTELNNLNDAQSGGGGLGNSTQALSYGGTRPGAPPYQSTKNEFWNGTSWTEVNDLATGRSSGIAPAGGGALGLVSGGQSNPSTQSTASEEWTADNTLSTVTVS